MWLAPAARLAGGPPGSGRVAPVPGGPHRGPPRLGRPRSVSPLTWCASTGTRPASVARCVGPGTDDASAATQDRLTELAPTPVARQEPTEVPFRTGRDVPPLVKLRGEHMTHSGACHLTY